MKTYQFFKKSIFGLIVIITVLLGCSSCNTNQRTEDSKDMAEDRNEEMIQGREMEKDAQFLVEAAAINLEEIHLGQLAQTKSTDNDVKQLGKMMENDHTKTLNELKELASKKGIVIPTTLTKDGQDAYDDLNDKNATDFNEDYCDKMVKGHKDAINKFEKASENAEDAEIKAWAANVLPTLRSHLDHMKTCQAKEDNKTGAILK